MAIICYEIILKYMNMYKTKLFVEEVMKRAASSATKPQLSEAPLEDGSLPIFIIFFPQHNSIGWCFRLNVEMFLIGKCIRIEKMILMTNIPVEDVSNSVQWRMNCQILLPILTSLTMMPSNSPGLAMTVPCRRVDRDNKESMNNKEKEENPCNVPVVVECENGGVIKPSGQCVCPRPFYGERCQKRFVILWSPGHTRF